MILIVIGFLLFHDWLLVLCCVQFVGVCDMMLIIFGDWACGFVCFLVDWLGVLLLWKVDLVILIEIAGWVGVRCSIVAVFCFSFVRFTSFLRLNFFGSRRFILILHVLLS